MTWGFPLAGAQEDTQAEAGELRPHRQVATAFWRSSFEARRCLVPMSGFAEAEGPKGHMTRTWLSLPDRPVFACAGVWRDSAEWGPVYSLVMTDACAATAELHDRLPVILSTEDEARWIAGVLAEALDLCRPWIGGITIERTIESWVPRQ